MRLPNRYGSVFKLSGKRHNPWCARKTIGWNDKGQPKYQYIGYFKTKAEALEALAVYNDGQEITSNKTFKEVYNEWIESYNAAPRTVEGAKTAFKICTPINELPIAEIRLNDLQTLVNESGKSKGSLHVWRAMVSNVFEYAVRHEYISPDRKQIVRHVDLSNISEGRKIERTVFTEDEIKELWKQNNKIILVMIYTGVRINELLELKCEDIDLEKQCFYIRQAKTKAGVRTVPICNKILPFFQCEGEYYLHYSDGRQYYYEKFVRDLWTVPNHFPHDTRHTFITRMVEVGADERVIETIVGHSQPNVTRSVYMHIGLETLLEAVNMLT